ncbi:MAG: NADH-quinone oxidoreductase subunit N [Planctomycetota bacterium]|nr:MAG: NADH-quinone oxidoreductase subunit N [Planctomycetota bacterium]
MDPLANLPFAKGDVALLAPIAIPALFGLVALLLDLALDPRGSKTPLALVNALGCALAGFAAVVLWKGDTGTVGLGGAMVASGLSTGLALAILLGTTLMGFATAHHGTGAGPVRTTLAHGELYGLMLFGTSGMLALVVANDLVTFFVAIETLSISVYALTGADRRLARSAEGAMKYFVLGAFSSGFLLYGMSLLYGAGHTLRLDQLALSTLDPSLRPMATTGTVLLLVGLLFKVGAVPFHAWVPDAYEGAPGVVTGYMSVGVKVAAFGGALLVLEAVGRSGALSTAGIWGLWAVAAITIIAGNAGALTQRNPRRLLAYSGIAHTGYLLVGVVAMLRCFDEYHPAADSGDLLLASKDAVAGVGYYLLGYAAANAGAFAVLCHLERGGEEVERVSDLAGLARTSPGAAVAMTVSLVSLAGIPGTAGFLGKLWVFRAGVGTGDVGLVVLALLASAVSLYYYLYVVVVMFMHEPLPGSAAAVAAEPRRWASRLAMGAAATATVVLGVWPNITRLLGVDLLELMSDGAEALL